MNPVMHFDRYKYPKRPEANTIGVPIQPSKHNFRQPTPENWRKYADELEEYQKKKDEYWKAIQEWEGACLLVRLSFKDDLISAFGLSNHPKKETFWKICSTFAYDSHSFTDIYECAVILYELFEDR